MIGLTLAVFSCEARGAFGGFFVVAVYFRCACSLPFSVTQIITGALVTIVARRVCWRVFGCAFAVNRGVARCANIGCFVAAIQGDLCGVFFGLTVIAATHGEHTNPQSNDYDTDVFHCSAFRPGYWSLTLATRGSSVKRHQVTSLLFQLPHFLVWEVYKLLLVGETLVRSGEGDNT